MAQGAGGLDLNATGVASSPGARVVVIDGVDDRSAMARHCGAEEVGDLFRQVTSKARVRRMNELSGGSNVELEVTGEVSAFVRASDLAAVGGGVVSVEILNIGLTNGVVVTSAPFTREDLDISGVLRYDLWYLLKTFEFLHCASTSYPLATMTDLVAFALDDVRTALNSARRGVQCTLRSFHPDFA